MADFLFSPWLVTNYLQSFYLPTKTQLYSCVGIRSLALLRSETSWNTCGIYPTDCVIQRARSFAALTRVWLLRIQVLQLSLIKTFLTFYPSVLGGNFWFCSRWLGILLVTLLLDQLFTRFENFSERTYITSLSRHPWKPLDSGWDLDPIPNTQDWRTRRKPTCEDINITSSQKHLQQPY
jgi:hypothetical protein